MKTHIFLFISLILYSFTSKSTNNTNEEYSHNLNSIEHFNKFQNVPANSIYTKVKSLKILYSINDKLIYFINSNYPGSHHDFAVKHLNYKKSMFEFNHEQYLHGHPDRIYTLGYLSYFVSSDKYIIDFHTGNGATCENAEEIFHKIKSSTFIKDNLFLLKSNNILEKCTVTSISENELYNQQTYQSLNPEKTIGFLRKIDIKKIKKTDFNRRDIILLNSAPEDLTPVSGIISTQFQPPLSHLNVLCHNRKIPHMALKNGWNDSLINSLVDKLIYLNVTNDSFEIRAANKTEAEFYWQYNKLKNQRTLQKDVKTKGLIDLNKIGVDAVKLVGGKASNFSELLKISNQNNKTNFEIPENSFAIPFYYYNKHVNEYGITQKIENLKKDSLFLKNLEYRKLKLKEIRELIKSNPIHTDLVKLITNHLDSAKIKFQKVRFRSSTNAEDIEEFNGAGLYDSYSGDINSPNSIEMAIKKVWASLWNLKAYEEREYFNINQNSIAMGILVHRSFLNEVANGVVITNNPYNYYNNGLLINAQVSEISIVNPTESYLSDQIIYYDFGPKIYITHSTAIEELKMIGQNTVLTDEEIYVLRNNCKLIQNHYCNLYKTCKILDIEFKVDIIDSKRIVYIKQVRIY